MEKVAQFSRENKLFLTLSVGLVVGVLFFLRTIFQANAMVPIAESNYEEEFSLLEESSIIHSTEWMVDVKGEVLQPGVYAVAPSMRLRDAIALAGGVTKDADSNQVNFAQYVQDEMIIYVPNINESIDHAVGNETTESELLNINTASTTELATLPGIGEKKASLIIQYREENGPFTAVEDLLQVSGIGDKTLETVRELVTVGP